MKNTAALNWIKRNSVSELPKMVSLIICDALYSVCGVSMAVFAKLIIDSAQKGDKDSLIHNAIILLLVIVAQISLKLLSKALEVRISGRLEMKYKSKLFESILKKDYLKISQYHSGELMTRLTYRLTPKLRVHLNRLKIVPHPPANIEDKTIATKQQKLQ